MSVQVGSINWSPSYACAGKHCPRCGRFMAAAADSTPAGDAPYWWCGACWLALGTEAPVLKDKP